MLQIATLNVGGTFRSHFVTPAETADELSRVLPVNFSQPVIIALQEIFRIEKEGKSFMDMDAALVNMGADLRFFFATEADSEMHPHAKAWENPAFEQAARVSDGNGLLTNLEYVQWPWKSPAEGYPGCGNFTPIAVPLGLPRLHSTGDRDSKPRNAIVASLQTASGPIFFINTHLSTLVNERISNPSASLVQIAQSIRLMEVEGILSIVSELRAAEMSMNQKPRPVILVGDLNATPGSVEMQRLRENFTLVSPHNGEASGMWTHTKEKVLIDHILISDPDNRLKLRECYIHTEVNGSHFTDHLPVVAIFD